MTIIVTFSVVLVGWNCSSSGQTPNEPNGGSETQAYGTHHNDAPASAPKRFIPSSQQFKVRADTVTAQPRKKENKQKTSIEVRPVPPKKYYAVQIGAFKRESNIENNKKILVKRFHQPVLSFFDSHIKLTRICVGNFSSKDEALVFLKKMQSQFPKEYGSAWVAELLK